MREQYPENEKRTADCHFLQTDAVPAEIENFVRNEAGGESHEK